MAFLVFYTTYPDEQTARHIAQQLLDQRLIACANFSPTGSAYWWQGSVQQEQEWVAVLKTRLDLEAAVEAEILRLHPYETPCIVRYEVRANAGYEDWIRAETNPNY
jgi:periplasmic divalent cation tolerance protein